MSYDAETGVFTWKVRDASTKAWNSRYAGRRAGSLSPTGYRGIILAGRKWAESRLAWLIVYGEWPADHIDHINGDKSDNRILNLRKATMAENMQNLSCQRRRRTPGRIGTYQDKRDGRWQARIKRDGRYIHIGTFASEEEAHAAYVAAKPLYHTFSPRLRGGYDAK